MVSCWRPWPACWPDRRAPGRPCCRRCCGRPSSSLRRLRRANIGASTLFSSVSPVLPSQPACAGAAKPGQFVDGRRRRAQRRREVDVRTAQVQGRDRVERAGRQRADRLRSSSGSKSAQRRRQAAASTGGSVEATLTTTTCSSLFARRKLRDVLPQPGDGRARRFLARAGPGRPDWRSSGRRSAACRGECGRRWLQLVAAAVDQSGWTARISVARRRASSARADAADFMPADDEAVPGGQVEMSGIGAAG